MQYKDEWGDEYELAFEQQSYAMDGSTFLNAWCKETDDDETFWEPYGDVTVCLMLPPSEGCSFVDTNNMSHLIGVLHDAGAFEYTGNLQTSGFCKYPEVRWNEQWLKENITSGIRW